MSMLSRLKKRLSSPKFVGACLNFLAPVFPKRIGAISYRIFCSPQKGRSYTEKEERFLASATQLRLPVRDFEVQTYQWEGGPKKILLAHGWDSNVARWRGLLPVLQKENLTVLALDAPAHGKSGSKIANGILYAEAIEQVVQKFKPDYVVGHSFGGMSAAYYFSDYQALDIKKLILLATPSKLRTIEKNFNNILGLKVRAQEAMNSFFLNKIGFDADYFAVENFMKKVKIPGLVIHDEEDTIAPFEEGLAIHKNWKGSELFKTRGLGHSMQAGSVFKRMVEEIKKG